MKLSCFAVATILSGLFATSVNFPAKTLAQARKEPFPLVRGVTLGKLEYASFATSPEQPLEAAIRSAIKRFPRVEFEQFISSYVLVCQEGYQRRRSS
jgi:hypothetical protein